MNVRVVITSTGEVAIAVDNAQGLTFEEAKRKLQTFAANCELRDVPIVFEEGVERHVHGPDGQHVHHHTHQKES
jgi:beta-lactam-binding protein with PASTA domain